MCVAAVCCAPSRWRTLLLTASKRRSVAPPGDIILRHLPLPPERTFIAPAPVRIASIDEPSTVRATSASSVASCRGARCGEGGGGGDARGAGANDNK